MEVREQRKLGRIHHVNDVRCLQGVHGVGLNPPQPQLQCKHWPVELV